MRNGHQAEERLLFATSAGPAGGTRRVRAVRPAERVHSTATACGDRLDASQARLLCCAVRERAAGLLPRHVVTLGAYKVKCYS